MTGGQPLTTIETFVVAAHPHLVVAPDGAHVAIADAAAIAVFALDSGEVIAAGGLDAEDALTLAWLGPDQLITFTRDARVRVVSIDRVRARFELVAETSLPGMVLRGVAGDCALATSGREAVVLGVRGGQLEVSAFRTRRVPTAIGAAGHGHLVVAAPGTDVVEEWDLAGRRSKRRLKLPPNTVVHAVGGSDHLVWWVAPDADRVEVIPLVTRNQPRVQLIGEPIAQIVGWPRSDAIACVGARTGRVVVLDLDGARGPRTLVLDPIDRPDAIALGATVAIVAQVGKPLVLAHLGLPVATEAAGAAAPAARAPAPDATSVSAPPAITDASPAWRDELATWIQSTRATRPPHGPALRELAVRLALPEALLDLLALVYGAHLCGEPGVPPINARRVSSWSEALGLGLTEARGAVELVASRLCLTGPARRWLDEAPPATGVLVGTPRPTTTVREPSVIVATEPPAILAARLAAELASAILVVAPTASVATAALEARIYGAIALHTRALPGSSYILVVPDEDAARGANLPRYSSHAHAAASAPTEIPT